MHYVYEWFIKDTGEIIYVGKGTNNRYKVRKHNKLFNEFIKRFDCDSRIIKTFDTEKETFDYEYNRILELKLSGQCICNIYSGGTGGTLDWWTPEIRKRYSENNVMKSIEQRKRMKENNPMKNKEIAYKSNSQKKKKVCVGNKIYDGIIDLAKEYKVYDTAIQYWLKRGYAPNYEPCYYYGEEKPIVNIKKHGGNRRAVIIGNKRFESVKDAANYYNVWSETIIKHLKKNKLFKGQFCRYDNQQPSQENFDKSILEGSETNG